MNAATELLAIEGPAGALDVAFDPAVGPVRGFAVIAHPHPLHGGTRDNKVVQTLARALARLGYACWRPNFRGVGASAGTYDEGRGETDDLLAVAAFARRHASVSALDNPLLVLAGFSFGGFVQTRVAQRLEQPAMPAPRLVLVAPAVTRFEADRVPPDTLIVHGDEDDVIPLAAVMDWARAQDLPVTVVPGTGHFFHGRLPLLQRIVQNSLAAAP